MVVEPNYTLEQYIDFPRDSLPTLYCVKLDTGGSGVVVPVQRLSIYSDPGGQDNARDSTVSDEIQQFASRNPPSASITVLKREFPGVNRRTPTYPGDKL